MKRMSFEIFNNRSYFIHKEFKIRNIHSSLSSREFKSFLKESFINPDSIFDIEDIFSIKIGLLHFQSLFMQTPAKSQKALFLWESLHALIFDGFPDDVHWVNVFHPVP